MVQGGHTLAKTEAARKRKLAQCSLVSQGLRFMVTRSRQCDALAAGSELPDLRPTLASQVTRGVFFYDPEATQTRCLQAADPQRCFANLNLSLRNNSIVEGSVLFCFSFLPSSPLRSLTCHLHRRLLCTSMHILPNALA